MRFKKSLSIFIGLILVVFSVTAVAVTLGDAASSLMAPTEIVTKMLTLACYVVGIALIIASGVQYKMHRRSPKLVPLSTPVLLVILGVVLILLPYFTGVFGDSFSATEQAKREGRRNGGTGTLPPLKSEPRPGLDKKRLQEPTYDEEEESNEEEEYYEEEESLRDGGHWSQDPQYSR